MTNPAPLNIVSSASNLDLVILSDGLYGTPEALYWFYNHVSHKNGARIPGKGTTIRVNRLLPFLSPDPDNLGRYDAPTGFQGTPTPAFDANPNHYQALQHSSVDIQVRRRRMPDPSAYKFETEQMSQQNVLMQTRINLRRNFREYMDDMVREEYRSHASTKIFGAQLRASSVAMLNNPTYNGDGFSVGMIKEFKRRMAVFHARPFGSEPGGDMQSLAGSFMCVTDQQGVNEITEDPLWRDMVIRDPGGEKGRIVKGYVGEHEQVIVAKSERMRTPQLGPSGATGFAGHEAIFMACDPVQIEPGDGNDVNGFKGEMPVVLAELGLPEVKRAAEDEYGENLVHAWFHTMGVQATEEIPDQQTASYLQFLLGGAADFSKGVPLINTSRYITLGLFA